MPFAASPPDFKSELSFESLFAFWKDKESHADPGLAALARRIGTLDHEHPPLSGPEADTLFSALFPAATLGTDIGAVVEPFAFQPLYSTPSFAAMMHQVNHHMGAK